MSWTFEAVFSILFSMYTIMKLNVIAFSVVAATLGLLPCGAQTNTPAGAAPAANAAPKIVFATNNYNFGKVESGEPVKYEYIFTNTGNATLEVSSVKPGCGCTTAGTWDKLVEPGKTGKIPVQFNSGGYGGAVGKSITVTCNDPANPTVMLQLSGTVWKPIDIIPAFAMFNLSPELQTNQTQTVRIVNNMEEPVTISDPTCSNPAFKIEFSTNTPGKEYALRVTVVTPLNGANASTPITLKTTYAKMPVITVTAFAMVQQLLAVTPNQINLPPGPLPTAQQHNVTIQNNGTNAMALSDAAINIPGAEVQLREFQAGHLFTLTATFPAGFQRPSSATNAEIHIKSNHPKYPLITIPVIQPLPPPPAAPAPAAVPAAAPGAQSASLAPKLSPAAPTPHP
jgi:hypothetical protein